MPSGTCSRRVAGRLESSRIASGRIASVTRAPGAGQGQRASAPSLTWLRQLMAWRPGHVRAANLPFVSGLVAANELAPAAHGDQDQAQPRDDRADAEGDTPDDLGVPARRDEGRADAKRAGAGSESHKAPDHGEGSKKRQNEQKLKHPEPIELARLT